MLGLALVGASASDKGAGEPGPFSHPLIRLAGGTLLAASADGAEELSDPVAYCLSCHGEEAARSGAQLPHPAGPAGLDHPVDVRYPESDPDYRPASELAPGLLLADRRVTCLSCHAHDDPSHAPVLATDRSELCRACHLA